MNFTRFISILVLLSALSLLILASYVLWNFNLLISEQLEIIELEKLLGQADPAHIQHIEWISDNGLMVSIIVTVGSMIELMGAWYLRQLRRKGMLFLVIGASLIVAAMIMLFQVHPLMASVLIIIQGILTLFIVLNRSKLKG